MAKKKTSKKSLAFSVKDMPIVTLKKGVKTKAHDPLKKLGNQKFISQALGECLLDGDKEAFIEILGAYYKTINKTKKLDEINVKPRTFYDALKANGNPTLETIMKITSGLKSAWYRRSFWKRNKWS